MKATNYLALKDAPASRSGSYVPAFTELMKANQLSNTDLKGKKVTISTELLRFLLVNILVHQSFDEGAYRQANPDVADAIQKGKLESGWVHYMSTGYFEGRETGSFHFDEKWYRRKNPDVTLAERRGTTTAYEHYLRTGRHEGRAGNELHEQLRFLWKSALSSD